MNIIEALKTGRKIKRAEQDYYYLSTLEPREEYAFCVNDLLADDWEVEPPKVTITREHFDKAWFSATGRSPGSSGIYEILVKELGL